MAEEQAHVAMSQAEAEVEQAAPDDLPPPSEPPPPWAELPAPALDATLAALGLQDRLSASAACKSWLDASSVSAALWGTLMLDEESGVGGNSKPVLFPGLVNLLKTLKSGGDDSPPPPPAAEPQPEGTVAWFRRRAGAIRSLTVSTWDEQCAEQLAPLVPLALRGLAAADDSSAGAGSGGGGAAHGGPRPGLRELTISLEGSMPLDDCPDLLAGCSGLRRLTLTTASLQVMSSLPTSLSTLNLTLQLPTDGRMPLQEYLSIVVEAAEPLGRLTSLRQLDFKSNALVQGAVPVPFAPPQLAQLAVRQPSLAMVPPQISRLSRMEKLDIISEIRWGGEGGSGGQGQEGAGAEGDAQQEDAPDSGQLIYRFVLPDEVDTLSRLRSLRFYNCWFDELPEVITALGSLEELAIKNSRLSAFPDQLIDMSGLSRLTSLRFGACCFATLPASLSGLSALKQLSLEVMPVSGGMGLMFGASRPLAFAPQLSQLTSLEDLEFYGCSLRELPPAIAGMKGLRRILVSSGAIEVHDKFFVHRNAAFGLHVPQGLLLGLEQLQELKLLGCNFKDHAAVLHLPPSVTHVTLLSSDTTSVDFGPHATGLEEVDLLGNSLQAAPPSLAAAAGSLRVVRITGTDKEHPISQEALAELAPRAQLVPHPPIGFGQAECIPEDEDLGSATAFFAESGDEEQCSIM